MQQALRLEPPTCLFLETLHPPPRRRGEGRRINPLGACLGVSPGGRGGVPPLAPAPPLLSLAPALVLPESVSRPGPGCAPQSGTARGLPARMQAPHKEHLYKLLVIGDLGVGKTSIIKRYVHQNFSSHYRATIGVDFALKVLHWDPETVVRLQLWDIAGEHPSSRAGGPRSGSAVPGQGGCGPVPGAAPHKTFPGGLETWFQRKQKFLSC